MSNQDEQLLAPVSFEKDGMEYVTVPKEIFDHMKEMMQHFTDGLLRLANNAAKREKLS